MRPRWTYAQHFDEHVGNIQSPLTAGQLGKSAQAVGTFLATGEFDRSVFNVSDIQGHTLTTSWAMTAATAAVDLLLNAAAHAGTPITTSTPAGQIPAIAARLGTP
ncbi:MAG: hypothetical protein M0010_15180, partial [Actinomycetota bacterium]|nr:hypothetical protein [Actinomycetota bacterium]